MTGSDSADGEELGDAVMVGGVDGDSRGADVLFELGEGCGADDDAGDSGMMENPGEGELSDAEAVFGGDVFEGIDAVEKFAVGDLVFHPDVLLFVGAPGVRGDGSAGVFAGEDALGEGGEVGGAYAVFHAGGQDVFFDVPGEDAVEGLVDNRFVQTSGFADVHGVGDLIGAPFAGAPVGGPAAAHDIVHGFYGFPEFGFRIVAVAVEYVHVFEFEAFKAAFDGIDDVLAAEALVGGMIGHGPEYLGGHHVGTPVVSGEDGAQEGFGGSSFVDVGGVDVVDAQFQGPGDDFLSLIQFNLVGECEPGAVGDFAYGESAAPDFPILHAVFHVILLKVVIIPYERRVNNIFFACVRRILHC